MNLGTANFGNYRRECIGLNSTNYLTSGVQAATSYYYNYSTMKWRSDSTAQVSEPAWIGSFSFATWYIVEGKSTQDSTAFYVNHEYDTTGDKGPPSDKKMMPLIWAKSWSFARVWQTLYDWFFARPNLDPEPTYQIE